MIFSKNSKLPIFLMQLGDIPYSVAPTTLERLSKDYYWYSPLLKAMLADKLADVVVFARDEADVLRLASLCATHQIPITVRGGGTGNYGQCVPLQGGVILDVTGLNKVLAIEPGWMRVQSGILIDEADQAANQSGQALLMWPSTKHIATLGGFVAGGYAGVGSIRHGILKDEGNVRMIKVCTLEQKPRLIELRGNDIQKVHHAFGTNGILLEVEVALAPQQNWLHVISLFDRYEDSLSFGVAASNPTLDTFLLTTVERRFAPFFDEIPQYFPNQADAMFAMVNENALADYETLAKRFGGKSSMCKTLQELKKEHLPPAYECAYNHTTQRALAKNTGFTYLQIAYPHQPFSVELISKQMARYGDELFMHHEFAKQFGQYVVFALPLLSFMDEERTYEVIHEFEADGCLVFDPHVYTIEDGGMKEIDQNQIEFKKLADPLGLMNPGKTRGWIS